jgi:hypothetical protein
MNLLHVTNVIKFVCPYAKCIGWTEGMFSYRRRHYVTHLEYPFPKTDCFRRVRKIALESTVPRDIRPQRE